MATASKRVRAIRAKLDDSKTYTLGECSSTIKEHATAKFNETVELAFLLGVDPRHADQMVRGSVSLPHGTGKEVRVVVFCKQEDQISGAKEAGAIEAGAEDLVAKIQGGWTDFDAAVATPDMMGQVGRLGKVLGPRGLMPSPKAGTVTPNVAEAVGDWSPRDIAKFSGLIDRFVGGLEAAAEIAQIGVMIDNTTKTRAIFEINKGTNKNSAIDVNAKVGAEDRRVPLQNMIYIADGPSDVPSFSVVKNGGGRTYGVYNPTVRAEFEQNDRLRANGRIDHYGPADYTEGSPTSHWLQLQVEKICERIVADREAAVAQRVARPPRHLNATPEEEASRRAAKQPKQATFLE